MSDVTPDYPVVTDDDGSGRVGTPLNNANLWTKIKTAINNQVLSGTNPALTPAQIIDEVVTARGALGNLAARLASVISGAGAFIVPATVVSTVQGGTLPSGNLVENGNLLVWCGGDNGPPTGFTVTNALQCQRAGPGSGISTVVLTADENCIFLPVGAAAGYPAFGKAVILNATEFARAPFLKNRSLAFGARIKSTDANVIGIAINDGVNTTTYFHNGNGAEQWVGGLHTIAGTATKLEIWVVCNSANAAAARVGSLCAILSDVALKDYVPPVMQGGAVHMSATSAVAADINRFLPGRMGIITGCLIHGGTGANSITVDVKMWDQGLGASATIFAGGGPILTGASPFTFKASNGTYYRRCFQGTFVGLNGEIISFDITADTTGGIRLTSEIRLLQYVRPLEAWKDHLN